jgi:subfamily B ATP-binding cassette protein MsbA
MAIIVANSRLGGSIAILTAFLVLLYRSQPHLSALAQARVCVAARQGSLREVEWLLAQVPTRGPARRVHSTSLALDQPIEFRNVSYRYPNGTSGLDNASFVLRPGSATALIGPSGSGKSTIVNLVCRLLQPGSGEILLGRDPVDTIELRDWLSRVALAGQDVELVTGSVAFNIAYSRPEASRDEIEAAARAASADDFIDKLPGGYEAAVGEGGISLSGGQRQRIGLARALLRRPDLLILDEATSAVDAMAEGDIMRLLSARSHFKTALVISHRRSTLAACTEGVVLETGRVIESGKLPDLRYFLQMTSE